MATICNFNVNNLFVRYRFDDVFPGDASRKSAVTDPKFGYLPMYNPCSFELFNPVQRELAARAVTSDGTVLPDVLLLQEVESLIALRAFNADHFGGAYPNALVIDSRDLRQIDVACSPGCRSNRCAATSTTSTRRARRRRRGCSPAIA